MLFSAALCFRKHNPRPESSFSSVIYPWLLIRIYPECFCWNIFHTPLYESTNCLYWSMSLFDSLWNTLQSTQSKQSCNGCPIPQTSSECLHRGWGLFQFLPISSKEQDGKVIRFAKQWVRGFSAFWNSGPVQYVISMCVYIDMLEIFWQYLRDAWLKSLMRTKFSVLLTVASLSARYVPAFGRM